jgi:hypothetical protein
MTSILSSISGYFSKSLILGTFLPVVIFIVLSWLLLVPLLPGDSSLFEPLKGLDPEWKIVAVSFTAIVLSGLMYNLNVQILSLFEGYPWGTSWIGKRRKRHYVAEIEAIQARIDGLRALLKALDAAERDLAENPQLVEEVINRLRAARPRLDIDLGESSWKRVWSDNDDAYQKTIARDRWNRIRTEVLGEYTTEMEALRHKYPPTRWVMPTRLGNAIRSFYYYPKREYGIDAIEMWPRLVLQIDKDYAAIVDDAKTSFDFFINCTLLSGLLATAFLLVAVLNPASLGTKFALLAIAIRVVVFAALAYSLYQVSIARAREWGKMVKSAFDLYRWKLLDQLGYKQQLHTRKDERDLWEEISRQTIYGDSFVKKTPLDYADAASYFPTAAPAANDVVLEVARGVKLIANTQALQVFLKITNSDPALPAKNIVISDKVPDGFDYEWDSASTAGEVTVTGANPYQFKIAGELAAGQSLTLEYRAISLQPAPVQNFGFRFGSRHKFIRSFP